MRPKALIADDEPALRASLRRQLGELMPELEIVAEAGDGDEAAALLAAHRPEVAFLDIRMPGRSGLAVAAEAPAGTRIVLVTAFDQYAVAAFEENAVDYLLKPVSPERLARTVARLRERLVEERWQPPAADLLGRLQALLLTGAAAPRRSWIRAGQGEEIRLVPVAEVAFFRAEDKYTVVATRDNQEHLIRTPLRQLEAELDPERFWRIHRSIIVAAGEILRARRTFTGGLEISLRSRPETLPVSRAYAHLFQRM
ncbi:MAG: LytTR family DNA-binding domain-containing protein [Thermodesulfobacteriota bacterium]